MTVDAVAAAAGVSAPTVYLRYPTKHDLAVAAIARRPFLTDLTPTGDSKADLVRLLAGLAATARTVGLGILGVVLAEEPEHPELLRRWRDTVGTAASTAVRELVERGQDSGQLRGDLDAALVTDVVIGAYVAHYIHDGHPGRAWPEAVVTALWPAFAVAP
jgi:AcrR family transcriptional regulator